MKACERALRTAELVSQAQQAIEDLQIEMLAGEHKPPAWEKWRAIRREIDKLQAS